MMTTRANAASFQPQNAVMLRASGARKWCKWCTLALTKRKCEHMRVSASAHHLRHSDGLLGASRRRLLLRGRLQARHLVATLLVPAARHAALHATHLHLRSTIRLLLLLLRHALRGAKLLHALLRHALQRMRRGRQGKASLNRSSAGDESEAGGAGILHGTLAVSEGVYTARPRAIWP